MIGLLIVLAKYLSEKNGVLARSTPCLLVKLAIGLAGINQQRSVVAEMIGLVIVAHGGLAREFKAALEHVVGKQKNLATVSIEADDDLDSRRADIVTAVTGVETGQGVIIVTDMFGGTPSNLAISVMDDHDVEVIAGANLPTLIKIIEVRTSLPLQQTVDQALQSGRKYINAASHLLKSS